MKKAVILLMDSFGVGSTYDTNKYDDQGSDTLGHIIEQCANGKCNNKIRKGPLYLPNLSKFGLEKLSKNSRGKKAAHSLGYDGEIKGAYGYAVETSKGKDTPSGHWEITGVPVMFDWGYFPKTEPTFPKKLVDDFVKKCKLPGILGNKHASGTVIINEFGDEHIKTGKPIVYTSGDSVFQIAAHEKYFGLENLYKICDIARELVNEYNIGRVIARPFIGEGNGNYKRTGNRHDISVTPPEPTLLDIFKKAGGNIVSVGKIADIFANSGITKKVKGTGLEELFNLTLEEFKKAEDNTLIFTNFVDFDSEYGHRRDVAGYATALEYFDSRIPEIEKMLNPGDLIIISADHGCDPTWPGTDHTRENIPIMFFGREVKPGNIGERKTFSDIGQTIAKHLNAGPLKHGTACEIFEVNK
jgi:phosphopentomutase